jgi:hypothetical protein
LLKHREKSGVFYGCKIYRVSVISQIILRGSPPFTPFRGVTCILIHTSDFFSGTIRRSGICRQSIIARNDSISNPTSEGVRPPCGASIFCSKTVSVQQKIQLAICHVANKICPEQGQI